MIRYGIEFPDDYTDLDVERWCFMRNVGPEMGHDEALGPAGHARKGIDLLWNYEGSPQSFAWTPWAERMLASLCRERDLEDDEWDKRIENLRQVEEGEVRSKSDQAEYLAVYESSYRTQYLGLAGCASSGKTGFCAVWGIWNYVCDPGNTKVFATSTSLKEAHNRIWGQVIRFWSAMPFKKGEVGKVVASLGLINGVNAKGEFVRDRGLELIAGEKRQEEDAISKLKGFKAPRVIFLADELSDLSHALVTAMKSNLKANKMTQFIGSSNPDKFADPFGLLCEPKDGWDSITADDDEWESKDGFVLHFDARKNPNILAGRDIYPFLLTNQDYKEMVKELGEDSRAFWQMLRGFWSPTGKDDAIYTEQDLMQGNVIQIIVWRGQKTRLGFIDPDFSATGDGCPFIQLVLGPDKHGTPILNYEDVEYFRESKSDKRPRSYQLVAWARKTCESQGISPEHFGFDASAGSGSMFGDVVTNEWSGDVFRLPFSGSASTRMITFAGKKIPANERYYLKVTELWFGMKEFLFSGQLAGLDPKLKLWKELTTRLYEPHGKLVQAERKKLMRQRIGYSPNEADAYVGAIELARQRLKFHPVGVKHEGKIPKKNNWNQWVLKNQPTPRKLGGRPGVQITGVPRWR